MKKPSEENPDWETQRNKIIGLGETSIRKSYYPELQQRILELERKNEELHAAYEEQAAVEEELRQQFEETITKEKELAESQERFSHFMRNLPAAVYIKDYDGKLLFSNNYLNELLGWSEPTGKLTSELLPETVAKKMVEDDRHAISKGSITTTESLTDTHGIIRTFSTTKFALPVPSGQPLVGGISIDITKRKEAEDALKLSEERYRSLVDITDTGYLVLNSEGRVVDANKVYVQLTGRSSLSELIGHSVTEWTAPHDIERNASEVEKCIRTGRVRALEIDYIRPDGTLQPIEINATVFHGEFGYVILTICRDISERKRTNVALQQARNKLNLLNAVTFQDIQTAAFSLSAYQELVKGIITDPKAKSHIEKQELFLKKMTDTLEFAKNYQEMGIYPARWQNVRQVFLYAISHLDFLHMKQNVSFDNLEVFADPLFEKTLSNIMDNILRHGVKATEVTIRYEERPDCLILFVMDNGIGIPAEEKNMIFDRGYGKGTGLGLFLVREVLSITGMTIKETGVPGQGLRMEISIPKGAYRFSS